MSIGANRANGGGVVIPVSTDTADLVATVARGVAEAQKVLKLRPTIDHEESAILAGVKRIAMAAQRAMVREKVVMRVESMGMGDLARDLGLIARQADTASAAIKGMPAIPGGAPRLRSTMMNDNSIASQAAPGNLLEAVLGKQASKIAGPMAMVGAAAHLAGGGLHAAGAFSNAFGMASSGAPMMKMKGTAGMMGAMGDLPVLGQVIKGFDSLVGITASLNYQMGALSKTEHARVRKIEAAGDPEESLKARAEAEVRDINRSYAEGKGGRAIQQMVPFYGGFAKASKTAHSELLKANDAATAAELAVIERGKKAEKLGVEGDIDSSKLRVMRMPNAAAREALAASGEAEWQAAPAYRRDWVAKRNEQARNELNSEQDRAAGISRATTNRETGAAQIRTRNGGLGQAADAASFLAASAAEINFADNEHGLKARLSAKRLAESRARLAGFEYQSGGEAMAFDITTMRRGDQLGLNPALRDRDQAVGMLRSSIRSTGGFGADNTRATLVDTGAGRPMDLIARSVNGGGTSLAGFAGGGATGDGVSNAAGVVESSQVVQMLDRVANGIERLIAATTGSSGGGSVTAGVLPATMNAGTVNGSAWSGTR